MVLDMGGGTVDIVVHKIMENDTLAEVYKASAGDWGGTIVDAQFKEFVVGLLKNNYCFEQLWDLAPLDALDFERDFEAKKRQISRGTIDTVVHKIMKDETLVEVYKASGGDWGGTIVDAEFKAFVTKLFKNEHCIDKLWELAPRDALEFERDFEAKKRQISCDTSLDDIRLQIPYRLKMFANTEVQEHIYVYQPQFQGFFKTAKEEIIRMIENIIAEVESIEFIILVGGFSCSEFLKDSIRCHPAFSTIKVISPPEPGTVVLKGAVAFGYSPRAVSARICRYSYGLRVNKPFGSKIHPQCKRVIIDGDEICKDVFHGLVYKNDLIKYDEERSYTGISRHRNKDRKFVSIEIILYEAKNVTEGQLAFVTDEGFKSVGKIVCKPPENGWPDTVKYTLKIYFGQTNIRIETCDTANNVQIKTSFELD
uniref:Heat shock 70 kDa protein 12B n=1 Tax=Magallana gigas TaxID=29159 RepID=K1R2D7_MAGGI